MATGFKGLNDLGKVLAAQEKSIMRNAQKRALEDRQTAGNTQQTQLAARGTAPVASNAGAGAPSRGLGTKPAVRAQKRVDYDDDEPLLFRVVWKFIAFLAGALVLLCCLGLFFGGIAHHATESQQQNVQQQKSAPKAAPAPKKDEYAAFHKMVGNMHFYDAQADNLAAKVDHYQGDLGRAENLYDEAVRIADSVKALQKELDGIKCPSKNDKIRLNNLLVLINNRVVGRANAIAAASKGQSPVGEFAKGRQANADFQAELKKSKF